MEKLAISAADLDFEPRRADSSTLLTERRNAIRYVVSLKVAFRWTDFHGLRKQADGQTRDVSPKGAFVLATNCPPHRAKVQIEFELSPKANGSQGLRLEAEGSVLRAEHADGRAEDQGFAIQLRRTRVLAR
jgi:hypothetical protein